MTQEQLKNRKSKWPKEGQIYDEVGSAVVNARSRHVILVGSERVLYRDEVGRERSVKIMSFIRWARTFAEIREYIIPKK